MQYNNLDTDGTVTGVFTTIECLGVTEFELDPVALKELKIKNQEFPSAHGFLVHSILRDSKAYK